ncbi:hypothetical protein LC608_31020 [Nostoc sp. XA010]|uniref:hypothetical protein n=1 Tax=Nostoc sp. XA010 TaxID=2780407 RepID=UPI001E4F2E53|nr:hypothetical protein [Nostoc sp. XA010]MCC5661309.1 hypothetical protein [Nostoc sp. XA010]
MFLDKLLAHRNDLDVQLSIRCNVDHENYESVSLLLQKLADEGLQNKLRFYVAPIYSWGNDAHTRSLTKEEFAEWEINWFDEMINLGFPIGFIPEVKPIVCMAVHQTLNWWMLNGTKISANPVFIKLLGVGCRV